MLIVSDTSAVTSLLQIGQCDLLKKLFGRVLLAPAVEAELLQFHSSIPEFLEIAAIRDNLAADALSKDLDRGEAESIVLAEEYGADYLLIDEKRGREAAYSRGIKVIGLLAVLLIAKRAGLISSVGDVIAELQVKAGFFVSKTIKQNVLIEAGEIL